MPTIRNATIAVLVIALLFVASRSWAAGPTPPAPAVADPPTDTPIARPNYLPVLHNGPTPTHTPTITPPPPLTKLPVPTSTPQLPPPSYNDCQADPNPGAAPNYPIRIMNIDKVAETVTLKNISTEAIDLAGWNMCSVIGNQHQAIIGTISPGQSITFTNVGGPIWNNSSPDPGALYNPDGQLVSYFNS
jgi:hypothetical protein